MIYIFVDDIRKAPTGKYITARDYWGAVDVINFFANDGIVLDLDHDLGAGKDGYDICKYVVENEIPLVGFHIHSMNPVGVANMRQLLTHYGYKEI